MNTRFAFPPVLAAGACILAATPALAADNRNETLSPVVVTATRVPQTADDTLSSVTVITRQDIEQSGAQSLPGLLQGRAGIQMTSSGGLGQQSSLFLRGANSNAVLVLVDGVRVGSVSAGGVSWELLPLSQIQRIEIVRGPHSVQYGADAVGGVIQIFTTHKTQGTHVQGEAGMGTYDTYRAGLGVSGGGAHGWYSVRGERLASDGFDAYTLTDPDSDGYVNNSVSANAGYRFDNGASWQVNAMDANGTTQYDRPFAPFGAVQDDYRQQTLSTRLKFNPLSAWKLTLLAGRSLDDRNSLNPDGSIAYRYDSTRKTYSWQNDFYLTDAQILTAGVDRYDDRIDSTTTFAKTERATRGTFAQYQGQFGAQSLLAGVRRTRDDQFGTHNTGDIAWAWRFDDGVKLRLSHATAFRAPTFNDLYYPFGYGNPDLQPETSRTDEIGLGRSGRRLSWQLNAYRTHVDDLIVYDTATFKPQNLNRATIDGVEATVSGHLAGLDQHLSLTWLDPRDDKTGNLLPRRAKRSLRWDISRAVGRTTLGATLIAQSWRYDDAANSLRVPGYGVVNLRGEYRVSKALSAYAHVDNLFDKQYETVKYYNTAGLSTFVGIRYQLR